MISETSWSEREKFWRPILLNAIATCPKLPPPLLMHEADELWIVSDIHIGNRVVLKVTRGLVDAYSEAPSFIAAMMCLLNMYTVPDEWEEPQE
jgi:hypothetical protein